MENIYCDSQETDKAKSRKMVIKTLESQDKIITRLKEQLKHEEAILARIKERKSNQEIACGDNRSNKNMFHDLAKDSLHDLSETKFSSCRSVSKINKAAEISLELCPNFNIRTSNFNKSPKITNLHTEKKSKFLITEKPFGYLANCFPIASEPTKSHETYNPIKRLRDLNNHVGKLYGSFPQKTLSSVKNNLKFANTLEYQSSNDTGFIAQPPVPINSSLCLMTSRGWLAPNDSKTLKPAINNQNQSSLFKFFSEKQQTEYSCELNQNKTSLVQHSKYLPNHSFSKNQLQYILSANSANLVSPNQLACPRNTLQTSNTHQLNPKAEQKIMVNLGIKPKRESNTSNSLIIFKASTTDTEEIQVQLIRAPSSLNSTATKLALRQNLEQTYFNILPPKAVKQPVYFLPKVGSIDFVSLLGLEQVSYFLDNVNTYQSVPGKINLCYLCKIDHTPLWLLAEDNSKIICESCYLNQCKKAIKKDHTQTLKSTFVKVLQDTLVNK